MTRIAPRVALALFTFATAVGAEGSGDQAARAAMHPVEILPSHLDRPATNAESALDDILFGVPRGNPAAGTAGIFFQDDSAPTRFVGPMRRAPRLSPFSTQRANVLLFRQFGYVEDRPANRWSLVRIGDRVIGFPEGVRSVEQHSHDSGDEELRLAWGPGEPPPPSFHISIVEATPIDRIEVLPRDRFVLAWRGPESVEIEGTSSSIELTWTTRHPPRR